MRYLIGLLLGLCLIGSAWSQELDYKELYLQQKIVSIQTEIELLKSRFNELSRQLPLARQELRVYKVEKVEEAKKAADAEAAKVKLKEPEPEPVEPK